MRSISVLMCRLTVRERIAGLCDPASFQEVGALAGKGIYVDGALTGVVPAPYVMGLATIDGRPVAIGGEDFTVRGGTSWGSDRRKGGQGGFVEDLAHEYRIPLVNLIDGAGGSVTSAARRGHTVFPGVHGFERSVQLMSEVPVVCAVMGTAAGGPAGRAILSHWSVMVKGTSQIFAAGPPVVERSLGQKVTKEELGGAARLRLAAVHGGGLRGRGRDRSARYARLPVPVHRCDAGAARHHRGGQAAGGRSALGGGTAPVEGHPCLVLHAASRVSGGLA